VQGIDDYTVAIYRKGEALPQLTGRPPLTVDLEYGGDYSVQWRRPVAGLCSLEIPFSVASRQDAEELAGREREYAGSPCCWASFTSKADTTAKPWKLPRAGAGNPTPRWPR